MEMKLLVFCFAFFCRSERSLQYFRDSPPVAGCNASEEEDLLQSRLSTEQEDVEIKSDADVSLFIQTKLGFQGKLLERGRRREATAGDGSTHYKTADGEYCPSGLDIISADECKSAGQELGLRWGSSFYFQKDHKYCLFANDRRKRVYFNRAGTAGALKPPNSRYASICQQTTTTSTTAIPTHYKTVDGEYCPTGLDVTSKDECKSAGEALGLTWGASFYFKQDHKYCLFANDGRSKVYFNTAGSAAAKTPPHSDYASICETTTTTTTTFTLTHYKTADGEYCPSGLDVTSTHACKLAGEEMGLTWGSSFYLKRDHKYCLFANDGRSKVYFNRAGSDGALTPPNSKFASICEITTTTTTFTPTHYKTSDGEYCPSDLDIISEDACKSAAEELGLTWGESFYFPNDHKYCLFADDGRRKVYYNLAGSAGAQIPPNSEYASICKKITAAPRAHATRAQAACKPPVLDRTDQGYADAYRGWYDVQGCGRCNDYCRWVGWSGSGGDPTAKVIHETSWWSCRLAGTSQVRSPKGHFQGGWKGLMKCEGEGAVAPTCKAPVSARTDTGYADSFRGWYDVQGCGHCYDYCRWVGGSGSGGDPTMKLIHLKSWWSCSLAGTSWVWSPKGHFTNKWNLTKCEGEGSAAPLEIPPATPYVPGTPGATWTEQEMLIVRAKLRRMFTEPSAIAWEIRSWASIDWVSRPSPSKILRLGFHDCLRYSDGTGGCDGCLQWNVGHRYSSADMGKGLIDASDTQDGHNNGLSGSVWALEIMYTDRAFPTLTPLLPLSLQQSGKSRADLWAFAVMEAVTYSMELNNVACEGPESVREQLNECHPRVGEADCKIDSPRPFVFKTGRKDCIGVPSSTLPSHSFKADKEELHPDPSFNGSQTLEFMHRDFNFTGREVVAIMGAHTLGRLHIEISAFRYMWKARSASLFNNGYFRNMAKKEDWYYDSWHTARQKPCAESVTRNSSGERPVARWMPHVRADTNIGGPVQWLQEKFVCPTCEALDKTVWWQKSTFDNCCQDVQRGGCKAGCEKWRFIVALDESMLSSDMGLYWSFNVDSDGLPYGCRGMEEFNRQSWGPIKPTGGHTNKQKTWTLIDGQRVEPICAFNAISFPSGSTPMYQVVEEYADDQAKFISDFTSTLEKMLSNGYSDTGLKLAPASGMSGFTCPSQDKSNASRYYTCTRL